MVQCKYIESTGWILVRLRVDTDTNRLCRELKEHPSSKRFYVDDAIHNMMSAYIEDKDAAAWIRLVWGM